LIIIVPPFCLLILLLQKNKKHRKVFLPYRTIIPHVVLLPPSILSPNF
jgi:hypothetical protein